MAAIRGISVWLLLGGMASLLALQTGPSVFLF
jgi:hypothetical protein